MENPADEADVSSQINKVEHVSFSPLPDSRVRTRKPLEMQVWDPKGSKGYIAVHILPGDNKRGEELTATGRTQEQAAANLFVSMQQRLDWLRLSYADHTSKQSIQREYLESVMDMPEDYEPGQD